MHALNAPALLEALVLLLVLPLGAAEAPAVPGACAQPAMDRAAALSRAPTRVSDLFT